MTAASYPRIVTSVLVEQQPDKIVVTWGLGARVSTPATPEYYGYEVVYYGPDGNGGKRLGVRFGEKVTAYIWDNADNNQSNYDAESVQEHPDALVVSYRDAGLGLAEIGPVAAYSHIDGVDDQVELPVTVLR
jgi:hypothetical protein